MIKRTNEYRKLINSQKWAKLRAKKLQSDPICERCKLSGIITPGAEIHHITPIDTGATPAEKIRLAYNPYNLQTLCHSCHVTTHKELKSKSAQNTKIRAKNTSATFVTEFLSEKNNSRRECPGAANI